MYASDDTGPAPQESSRRKPNNDQKKILLGGPASSETLGFNLEQCAQLEVVPSVASLLVNVC